VADVLEDARLMVELGPHVDPQAIRACVLLPRTYRPQLREDGLTLQGIADRLNEEGQVTRQWMSETNYMFSIMSIRPEQCVVLRLVGKP
jgi:hypothetical protein